MNISSRLLCMCALLCTLSTHAQWNSPYRYRQQIFPAETMVNIKVSTHSYNATAGMPAMRPEWALLTVYKPAGSIDPITARPLIVIVHGGAFSDVNQTKDLYTNTAIQYASMGYVVACINYRLYFSSPVFNNLNNKYKTDKNNQTNTVSSLPWYVAVQDLNAAIKYMCYNSGTHGIDRNKIFLMGESAGALTCLTFALNQGNFDAYFNFGFDPAVGPVNYSTLQVCKSQTFQIKGVTALSGALPYASLLSASDQMPLLLQNCTLDAVVPINFSPDKFLNGMAANQIMSTLKSYPNYPCSYLYRTYDATYSDPSAFYHTLTNNARPLFTDISAGFFADILYQNGVCKQGALTTSGYDLISSLPGGPYRLGENDETDIPGSEVRVFPNPVQDELSISGLPANTAATVDVYDAQGARVMSQVLHTGETLQHQNISLKDLPAGMYYIRIAGAGELQPFTVVKQ